MDLLKPARDEITSLEATIASAMVRLKDLRAFVEAGDRVYGPPTAHKPAMKSADPWPLPKPDQAFETPALPARQGVAPVAAQSKASQIVAQVEAALAGGVHMQSKDLVAVLQAAEIELGVDPIGSLSAYLSKSGRFVSERAKGGWAIKQPHKEEPPPDVTASAGA